MAWLPPLVKYMALLNASSWNFVARTHSLMGIRCCYLLMNKLWCASVHIWLIGFTIRPLKFTCQQCVLYTLTMASQTHSLIVFSFSISCGGSNDTRVLICLSTSLWQQTLWQCYTSHWILIILIMLGCLLPWLLQIPQSWWIYIE